MGTSRLSTSRLSTVERFWAAVCVYHESRGEPFAGQVAVAHVILNRRRMRHQNAKTVVLAPWQFSWANNNARPAITDYLALLRAGIAVEAAEAQQTTGETFSDADHYYAEYIKAPAWAADMAFVKQIGRHKFYRST